MVINTVFFKKQQKVSVDIQQNYPMIPDTIQGVLIIAKQITSSVL